MYDCILLIKEGDKIIVTNEDDIIAYRYPFIRIMISNGGHYHTNVYIQHNKNGRLSISLDNRSNICSIIHHDITTQNEELGLLVNELLKIEKDKIDQESAMYVFCELVRYAEEYNRIYDDAINSCIESAKIFRLHPNYKSANQLFNI